MIIYNYQEKNLFKFIYDNDKFKFTILFSRECACPGLSMNRTNKY